MKTEFVLRSDGQLKPGGDTSKALRLCSSLRDLGVESRVSYGKLSGSHVDVVHLVNADLPLENLRIVRDVQLRSPNTRIVISTVHHPFGGIAAYYESGIDRYFRRMAQAGLSWSKAVTLREWLKLARRASFTRQLPLVDAHVVQSKLLNASSAALSMASGETRALIRDLGAREDQIRVVPNGMTFESPKNDSDRESSNKWDAVVVGRVEPRKNTLAVARACASADIRTAFIGDLNGNHGQYTREFLHVVNTSKCLTYLGRREHSEVRAEMLRAKHYINGSYFEVVSQADVEAVCLGLNVVSTKWSYLADVVGDSNFIAIDPRMLEDVGSSGFYINEALASSRPSRPVGRVSWAEAGECLMRVYGDLLSV